ncbi:MAG: dipeptidyl aminopeptidase, partial [Halomonadaceae bacterium]|nr:dipeptidyl aminopeptidase [Halomonadaceae bacterium]
MGLAACGQAEANEPETERLLGYADDTEAEGSGFEPAGEHLSDYLVVGDFPGESIDADLEVWQEQVPDIEDIEIDSSVADHAQPALFYAPESEEERPLLMVLHSWSTNYQQNIDIPLAQFAVANDWAFIHPDFQGDNDGSPETTASDLVIADMEDVLAYAREHASVDE